MATSHGLGLGLPFGGQLWTPAALGSSLLGWWDAERTDLVTQSGGSVSSWKDIVAGYDATQATGASKPVYSASSFNGRPGVTFDGVDDTLNIAGGVPGAWPIGASAGEIWVLLDQKTAASTAGNLGAFVYGGGDTIARVLYRAVTAGVNNLRVITGDGASANVADNTSTDFTGRHVVRAETGATSSRAYIDGNQGAPAASVPATATLRARMGANGLSTPSGFLNMVANTILVTLPLSTDQSSQLTAYLKARGSIA